jgi:hypothetical protein
VIPAAVTYRYAGEYTVTRTEGVRAVLPITTPRLSATGTHSLAEVTVQNYNQNSMVEVGWIRQPGITDHLFVAAWRKDKVVRYDDCGPVADGRGTFSIGYRDGSWDASFDGHVLQKIPASTFGGQFRYATVEQAFAEVEDSGPGDSAFTHGHIEFSPSGDPDLYGPVTAHGAGWFDIG